MSKTVTSIKLSIAVDLPHDFVFEKIRRMCTRYKTRLCNIDIVLAADRSYYIMTKKGVVSFLSHCIYKKDREKESIVKFLDSM